MKKQNFPYLAVGLGLMLMLFILKGSETDNEGNTLIPLLTLLVFNECAFVLTAVGTYIGVRNFSIAENRLFYGVSTALCALLTVLFVLQGIKLWPL